MERMGCLAKNTCVSCFCYFRKKMQSRPGAFRKSQQSLERSSIIEIQLFNGIGYAGENTNSFSHSFSLRILIRTSVERNNSLFVSLKGFDFMETDSGMSWIPLGRLRQCELVGQHRLHGMFRIFPSKPCSRGRIPESCSCNCWRSLGSSVGTSL